MRQAADLRQRHNHALHELRRREQEYARLQDHLRELLGERVRRACHGPPALVVKDQGVPAHPKFAPELVMSCSLGMKCRCGLIG